jgi:hypothetical protein
MKERSLEDLELYVYTLRHAVVDCLSDSRDRREGDGAQCVKHEDRDGTREVFHMLANIDNRKEPQLNSHTTDATVLV